MIDLAQIEDKVFARLNAISAAELEQRLCALGYDVQITEREAERPSPLARSCATFETVKAVLKKLDAQCQELTEPKVEKKI